MLSASSLQFPKLSFHSSPAIVGSERTSNPQKIARTWLCRDLNCRATNPKSSSIPAPRILEKSIPLAASVVILLWSNPVDAGILSGSSGLESIPGPELPQFDFLKKWNEENQKRYAELDSRFKSSPALKELLEKSKLNKERNMRETQDKYCIRGAEWGVGDCSTQGMTQEERDDFIAMLKKRSEGE